jgi:hypothetical protein
VEEILAERQAAEQAKAAEAAEAAAQAAKAPANAAEAAAWEAAVAAAAREEEQRRARQERQERPTTRHCATRWESKLAAKAEAERAFLEGSSSDGSGPAKANRLPTKPMRLVKKKQQEQRGDENMVGACSSPARLLLGCSCGSRGGICGAWLHAAVSSAALPLNCSAAQPFNCYRP